MNQELSTTEAKQMKPIIFSTPMVQAILAGKKSQTRRIVKPLLKDCSDVHKVFKEADWKDSPASFVSSFDGSNSWYCRYCGNGTNGMGEGFKCPYGKVGDILYVRETWVRACLSEDGEGPAKGGNWRYWYKADDDWTKEDWHHPDIEGPVGSPRWKPSIHMPRPAARIFLKITGISVERLQDITEEDAIAEGVEQNTCDDPSKCPSRLKGGGCCGDGEYKNYLVSIDGEPAYSAKESFETLWQSINGPDSWEQNPWIWKITFQRIEKP